MARNITVIYGLLSVTCKYDGATERQEAMKNLCVGSDGKPQHDPQPLVMPKQCPTCGVIADFKDIVKGIKQGSTYSIVSQEDVAKAKAETAIDKGKIELVVHEATEFLTSTGQGASLNYVVPAPGSEDHYALLVKLVQEHPELAFAGQFMPVSKVGLYRMTTRGDVLVMEERTREQSMKPLPTVTGTVNEPMYDLLEATLDKMKVEYDPASYEDTYAKKIAELAIEAQDTVTFGSSGSKSSTKATVPATDADLMAKLKALAEA